MEHVVPRIHYIENNPKHRSKDDEKVGRINFKCIVFTLYDAYKFHCKCYLY